MSRTIPSAILTALTQPEVQPFYAVEFLFDTEPVRLWTGYGKRTDDLLDPMRSGPSIDGETYLGAGSLLNISGLEEAGDMSAKGVSVTLSSLPASLISLAWQEPFMRRKARILFGVQNVDDFVEVFSGYMNEMPIEDSAESGTISVLIDSKMVETGRSRDIRYTHESQQTLYPGDTFFSYVADLADKEVMWGRGGASAPPVNNNTNYKRNNDK
jgi:hypothetical protein